MSRTDKTRPWWVRMADAPGVTCIPVHDHRHGPCTLPDKITPSTASLNRVDKAGRCYWAATDHFIFDLGGVTGGREWQRIRRETRRRDRRAARRALRAYGAGD